MTVTELASIVRLKELVKLGFPTASFRVCATSVAAGVEAVWLKTRFTSATVLLVLVTACL